MKIIMRKEAIKDKDEVLALVLRNGDFPEGLNFHTQDSDFVQLATWRYNKGKESAVHSHNIVDRTAKRTQEIIYIKKGKVKFNIYTEEDQLCREVVLNAGDLIIVFAGGHGMEILEDGTQALEFKNGPYPGLEKDKREIK